MNTMLKDKREITSLLQGEEIWTVNDFGVTKIECYCEIDDTIWFAVWKGDCISSRVNSSFVSEIYYKEEVEK